jgi:outer membrane protein assembly factor BamD (BamD/ComL family)
LGKVYHNTTAQYNGYFNANELYMKSLLTLDEMQQDNFNQLLPLYTYRDVKDASVVEPDLNIAIEKVSKVINLHRVSSWTDDCYLLLGKAQYLKQDFETAEKTFEFFVDEMNPAKLAILKKPEEKETRKQKSSAKKKSGRKKKSSSRERDREQDVVEQADYSRGGFLSREPAYNEGLVWMGKTYIERERYPSAAYMIGKLESSVLPRDVAREVPVLKAYFFIRQKKYAEAVTPLKEAVERAGKKDRSRYAYILAQIYEMLGNEKGAYEMYNLVLDDASDYAMEFNAQLNLYKNALGGNLTEKAILKELDKMLKEEKYQEYQDQIYYTMAEIKFKQGDFNEAYKFYQLSLKNNQNNEALKAEVYYKLANRYFQNESYLEAKNYYDSTLLFMAKTDDRYNQVSAYVQNLNQIANNLSIIQLQDSLIRISQMTREEQEAIALALKTEREKMRKLQETSASGANVKNLGPGGIDRSNAGRDLSTVSSFFAYNTNSVRIGQLDFQRRWGDRDLEDDWRRSNKLGGFSTDDEELTDEESPDELTDAEFKTFLKDVPFNSKDLEAAEKKLQDAMLDLGILYRDKLENHTQSAAVLTELLERYPGYQEECKALYYLQVAYRNLGEQDKATLVLDRMVGEYPECSFTQALTDPEYLQKQMKLLNSKERYYEEVFALYKQGEYQAVLDRLGTAPEDLTSDPEYAPKLDFVEAMALGHSEGEEAYINSLENLVKRYPNTPEEIKAKEILRFIKGDSKAFESLIYQEGLENFVTEPDKLHYIFVVLYGADQDQLTEAKRSISKYNGTYHNLDRLRISNIYLDTSDDIQIILIRKFDTQDAAMGYYYKAESLEKEFLPEGYNYELFAISQKNYREVIKQRTVNAYREFFAAQYLEQ